TFYASERKITRENAEAVVRCIKGDGVRVVDRITEISVQGRAYKNDAALFALALCFAEGDLAAKHAARAALPKIARIGTHLFTFLEYIDDSSAAPKHPMRGWGPALKKAVQDWYSSKSPEDLAYQLVKYQQRGGWSHRDALRLAKPRQADEAHSAL